MGFEAKLCDEVCEEFVEDALGAVEGVCDVTMGKEEVLD